MKAIVLGLGYLGKEFQRQGYDCAPRYSLASLEAYDTIINCIGFTNTSLCEDPSQYKKMMDSNVNVPVCLSGYCKHYGKQFVHISTGCLYDKVNCFEDTPLTAHCMYTVSKMTAEHLLNPQDIIIRPRLFFDDQPTVKNFLFRLTTFDGFVHDNLDCYTYLPDVPKAVKVLVENKCSGAYNLCCRSVVSIYNLAFSLKLTGTRKTIAEVRKERGLHLVNCTMNTMKIEEFFEPSNLYITTQQSLTKMREELER